VIPKRFLEIAKKAIGKRAKVWSETAMPPGIGKERRLERVLFLTYIPRNNRLPFLFPEFWPLTQILLQ
jgi:hypothetical protein